MEEKRNPDKLRIYGSPIKETKVIIQTRTFWGMKMRMGWLLITQK
jgi:hypothetical protein